MNSMENFTFSEYNALSFDNTVVITINEATSKKELLAYYRNALRFPDYFGDNWDAFEECLHDLSWLSVNTLVINHFEIPNIDMNDFKVYLDILEKIVIFWNKENKRKIIVSFPVEKRMKLEQFLKK